MSVVIELDDRSHQKPSRIDRDNFLNAAVGSSQLTLLRFPAQASYAAAEIAKKVFSRRQN